MSCQFLSNFCQYFPIRKMPPSPPRSTNPDDYQSLPQDIAAMAKLFDDGSDTGLHEHKRDQLLYASRGIMRLRTSGEAWVVPPGSAVYIPAQTLHSVGMHGDVDMRTLYIDSTVSETLHRTFCVFSVSNLLRELILTLSEEPIVYKPGSRGDLIAQLIKDEISRAHELTLNVPLPKDERLQRLCAEILSNPSDRRTLENWAEFAGASPRTLARLFERDLGIGFNRWRQRIRLHGALEALSRGEPVSQVAKQHGYLSASAFSAAFGKVMGSPPSKVSSDT